MTGAATLDIPEVAKRIETIRTISDLPIGVGFGIKDAESAAAVAAHADGVVVGSALVDKIAQAQSADQAVTDVLSLCSALAEGVRGARR